MINNNVTSGYTNATSEIETQGNTHSRIDEYHEQLEKLNHEQLLKSLKITTSAYSDLMLDKYPLDGLTHADFYEDTLFQTLSDDHGYNPYGLEEEPIDNEFIEEIIFG